MRSYYVYILSNRTRTTLYIGVTNNLDRRVQEHKQHSVSGFTDHYNCTDLVYFEDTPSITAAIEREKQLKRWRRKKKEALIIRFNPQLLDLSTAVEMT